MYLLYFNKPLVVLQSTDIKTEAERRNEAVIDHLKKKCWESEGGALIFTALLPAHYCAGLVPKSLLRILKSQYVSAVSGHWRLHFSPMEESEGVSSIFFTVYGTMLCL